MKTRYAFLVLLVLLACMVLAGCRHDGANTFTATFGDEATLDALEQGLIPLQDDTTYAVQGEEPKLIRTPADNPEPDLTVTTPGTVVNVNPTPVIPLTPPEASNPMLESEINNLKTRLKLLEMELSRSQTERERLEGENAQLIEEIRRERSGNSAEQQSLSELRLKLERLQQQLRSQQAQTESERRSKQDLAARLQALERAQQRNDCTPRPPVCPEPPSPSDRVCGSGSFVYQGIHFPAPPPDTWGIIRYELPDGRVFEFYKEPG